MSDDHLRELEQRFRSTEAVADEGAWLRERLRLGEVIQEQIKVAAYCNHSASRLVLGLSEPHEVPSTVTEMRPWIQRMPWLRDNEELGIRISCVAAYHAFQVFEEAHPEDKMVKLAVIMGFRHLYRPVDDPQVGEEVGTAAYDASLSLETTHESTHAAMAAITLVGATARQAFRDAGDVAVCASFATSPQKVYKVVTESIIPWSLGYHDPLIDLYAQLEHIE